jgi:hypothetical protein
MDSECYATMDHGEGPSCVTVNQPRPSSNRVPGRRCGGTSLGARSPGSTCGASSRCYGYDQASLRGT